MLQLYKFDWKCFTEIIYNFILFIICYEYIHNSYNILQRGKGVENKETRVKEAEDFHVIFVHKSAK
jgi:hypothetical protein